MEEKFIKIEINDSILILTDKEEIKRSIMSLNLCSCLYDLDEWLRSEIKYKNKDEYEPIREKLHEIMNDNAINLNDLYQ